MDDDAVDRAELLNSLRFIRRVNTYLGYTRATVGHLARFARTWNAGERIDILDVGTGSADVPRAICHWAKRHGHNVRVVAVDRHRVTAREAARQAGPEVAIVQADARSLPFERASFDYVLSSMFLHHLDDDSAVHVLRSVDALARRGIIVADLLRHARAYAWTALLTALSTPMLRHDALVSVARSYTKAEVLRLRQRAGLSYMRYYRHAAHRFVLAGQKLP
jgi:SAM-dependent methyltransferase